MNRKKLLLHSCCGPCSTAVIERLTQEDKYFITVFYYNPNIDDPLEYAHRRDEQIRFIKEYNSKLEAAGSPPVEWVEGDYDPEVFLEAAGGLESCPEGGERCSACFYLRLSTAARYAVSKGFDCFDTTLSVSPYKSYDKLSEIGAKLAEDLGTEYLSGNYKKRNGYGRSLELSREYGLYRQHFCGCSFSKRTD